MEDIIDDKINEEKTKFRSNDFFIDISNFKLLNEDITYEEDFEDNMEEVKGNENTFTNVEKSSIDIIFI